MIHKDFQSKNPSLFLIKIYMDIHVQYLFVYSINE